MFCQTARPCSFSPSAKDTLHPIAAGCSCIFTSRRSPRTLHSWFMCFPSSLNVVSFLSQQVNMRGKLDRYSQIIVFISYRRFNYLGPHCSRQAPMTYTVTAGGLIKLFLTVFRDNIKFLQIILSIPGKGLVFQPVPANSHVYLVLGKSWRFVLYPRITLYTSLS